MQLASPLKAGQLPAAAHTLTAVTPAQPHSQAAWQSLLSPGLGLPICQVGGLVPAADPRAVWWVRQDARTRDPGDCKGNGSAKPRRLSALPPAGSLPPFLPLLLPLPRSPLHFREGSFLSSPCYLPPLHLVPGRLKSRHLLPAGSRGYSPDVVAVHVLLRAPMDDPVGQLLATATTQHHSWQEWRHRSAIPPQSPSPQSRAPPISKGSNPLPPAWISHLGCCMPSSRTSPLPAGPAGLHPCWGGSAPGTPFPCPPGRALRTEGEATGVPGGLLPALTCTVEAAAQKESPEFRCLPHQGLVVRCEGL